MLIIPRSLNAPLTGLRHSKRLQRDFDAIQAVIAGTAFAIVLRPTALAPRNMIGAALAGFWGQINHYINVNLHGDNDDPIVGPEVIPLTDNLGNDWWFSILVADGAFITWEEWREIAGTLYGILFTNGIGTTARYGLYNLENGAFIAEGYFETGDAPTNIWVNDDIFG